MNGLLKAARAGLTNCPRAPRLTHLLRISVHSFGWKSSRASYTKTTPQDPAEVTSAPRQSGRGIRVDDMGEVLAQRGIEFKETASHYQLKYCPLCTKPHNEDPTNLHVCGIHRQSGVYHCFRCGSKGNWSQFYSRVFEGYKIQTVGESMSDQYGIASKTLPQLSEAEYYIYTQNLLSAKYESVKKYIESRGFTEETMRSFNLGAGHQIFSTNQGDKSIECVYFPGCKVVEGWDSKDTEAKGNRNFSFLNGSTQICKAKIRGSGKQGKKFMKQSPSGAMGLFGLNLVRPQDEQLVITEGEWDAMAVYQATGKAAISLPNGATSLGDEFLPWLRRFKRIILWMDNDSTGKGSTESLVNKLNKDRTSVVRHNEPDCKDANDFLLKKPQMITQLLESSQPAFSEHSTLVQFNAFRESIKDRVQNHTKYQGVSLGEGWLPFFNKTIKGLRKGELTIVSGPTGCGKTTFLSQLSLDLCEQGHSVLWGSFEVRTEILMTSMLYQFSKIRLDKHIDKFGEYAERFSKLPMSFMNFYGSTIVQRVYETIEQAVKTRNCTLVVIDTLQFMLSGQGEGFKRFQIMDDLIKNLRNLSIQLNIHIAIVIHPRKTDEAQDIGIHSIYGTSKASQQADNVWVIQNRAGYKLFDVKKNRYDGSLGRIPIGFNRPIKSFFQLTSREFVDLSHEKRKIDEIIRDRAESTECHAEDQMVAIDQEIDDRVMDRKSAYQRSGSRFSRSSQLS